ncbi:hypothetical protein EV2_048105 [Malus domestica]|uniref:norbelladine synthase-like n=1 Tax=Malus domestica TaxID=3750 RepID=UPI0039758A7D
MAIGKVWHELEVEVPASEAWELFSTLALARFVEQQLPDMIEKAEAIHGDGGVGTIVHVKFASGAEHKEKFTKIDNETRVKEVEVIEGGFLDFGLSLYRVRFEIIEKLGVAGDSEPSCCCIIKTTVEYDVKEETSDASNASSLVSIEPFVTIAEAAKIHLMKKQFVLN